MKENNKKLFIEMTFDHLFIPTWMMCTLLHSKRMTGGFDTLTLTDDEVEMELVVITIVRFASLSSFFHSFLSFSFPPQLKSIAIFPRSTGYFLSYTYVFFCQKSFFSIHIFSTICLYPVTLLCGFLFQLGFYSFRKTWE